MRYTESQVSSELLDQPAFTGQPKKLFICSTPRSGSYLLCRYMINAGLGVPHEYFNPIIMRQIAPRWGLGDAVSALTWRARGLRDRLPFRNPKRVAEEEFLATYIPELIRRRCQSGIFAAKIHFDHFIKVLENPTGRRLLNGGLFIHLYREDLLKQAISAHFAHLTGRWGVDDTVTTTPATQPEFFDVGRLDRTLRDLAEDDCGWRVFLATNGLFPLSVSYEQLVENPFGFIISIAQQLGIDPTTLRQGYSESGSQADTDPNLPKKNDVARHYLAAQRQLHSFPSPRLSRPETELPAALHHIRQ